MKSINQEDNERIIEEWVETFFEIHDCWEFELKPNSSKWRYCPVCFVDRESDGHIEHKAKEDILN